MWKFLNFARTEFEKKTIFWNFSKNFQVIFLLPGETWNAEAAAKEPNGFAGKKLGQGRPLGEGLGKLLGKKRQRQTGFTKNSEKASKKLVMLSQFLSDLDENLPTHSFNTPEQYRRTRANRSWHLETRYGLSNLKNCEK